MTAKAVESGKPGRARPAPLTTCTLPSSQPTASESPPAKKALAGLLVTAALPSWNG